MVAAFFRRPQVVDEFAQSLAILLGQPPGSQKRRDQRGQRALAEPIGELLQAALKELFAVHQWPKSVRPFASVAPDAAFCLQTLDEFLDGRHFGVRHLFVDRGGDLAAGRLPAFPQDLKNGQFAVGDPIKFHCKKTFLLNDRQSVCDDNLGRESIRQAHFSMFGPILGPEPPAAMDSRRGY